LETSEGTVGLISSNKNILPVITNNSSINFKDLINNLTVTIDPFFTQDEINELARISNFTQRESKLKGSTFLNLIVFNSGNLKDQSLNDLTGIIQSDYGFDLRKQSLHERFNENALGFLKIALEELMHKQLLLKKISFPDYKGFNRILIKDSTSFQIDESLSEYYPGSGGSGSSASVRIQFEYDILSGSINDLSVTAFNDQDAKDSIATIELTEKGDLIIRDLAYMTFEVLKFIAVNDRFFLCRANTNAYLYEILNGEYVKIDFGKITKHMSNHKIQSVEKEAYYGGKKLKVRLILHLLPQEVVNKRIRNAIKNNIAKGGDGNLSKEHKAKISLNLFITNVEEKLIPLKNVWHLYRLRWQIELVFKIWKSICDIEKVKKVKRARLECYIYAKLIIIVLGWQVLWKIAITLFYREGKALSLIKASKTLFGRQINKLQEIFFKRSINSVKSFMDDFYNLSRTHHLLEKRRKELTSMELLLLSLTYS